VITPDLELKEVTQVMLCRLFERFERYRMLVSFGHVGEVYVVGGAMCHAASPVLSAPG
jgi:hypothetical protein